MTAIVVTAALLLAGFVLYWWCADALTARRSRHGAPVTREPRTHDFSTRAWGHAVEVTHVYAGGQKLDIVGWYGSRYLLHRGDYLILPAGNGRTTRYQIKSLECYSDSPDMFSAVVTFAPRSIIDGSAQDAVNEARPNL